MLKIGVYNSINFNRQMKIVKKTMLTKKNLKCNLEKTLYIQRIKIQLAKGKWLGKLIKLKDNYDKNQKDLLLEKT